MPEVGKDLNIFEVGIKPTFCGQIGGIKKCYAHAHEACAHAHMGL